MKVAVLALTPGGLVTARQIIRLFPGAYLFCHPRLRGRLKLKSAGGKRTKETARTAYYYGDLQTFVANIFTLFDVIVFVTATGIAVRMIAPCLRNKKTDPAIITVDDTGCFAVSLLGGHGRGANDLTEQIAHEIGAIAVITTATDRNFLLAFDLLARRCGWILENAEDMKKISAAQLEGKEIYIYSDLPLAPAGRKKILELFPACRLVSDVTELHDAHHGVVFLSNCRELPVLSSEQPYIIIRPRTIVAGVGCRRGMPGPSIVATIKEALWKAGRVPEGLLALATIELKRDEKGLQEAAELFNVPLYVFSSEQIKCIENRFTCSKFVRKHTGAGAVAEPCAYLGSGGGELISGKKGSGGITVALAEKPLNYINEQSVRGKEPVG